jgi:hypothetical protein
LGVVSQGGGDVGGAGEVQSWIGMPLETYRCRQFNILPSTATSLRPPAGGVVR